MKHLPYLERASKELAARESAYITIEGLIHELNSQVDPQSNDAGGRSVIIRGAPQGDRSRKIHVALGKDDYLEAIRAHRAWQTVSVSGYLDKTGGKWRVTEPKDFKVLR